MRAPILTVSTSPHLLGRMSVRSMHGEILIALVPALVMGFYFFGIPGLTTVLISTVCAVLFEFLACKIGNLPNRLDDLHAVLTGLLLGMILPSGAPWWIPVVGAFLAVVLGKALFGGLGNYPMNPVLIAWAALSLSWPEHMQAFYAPLAEGGEWELSETLLMQLKEDISTFEIMELPLMWRGEVPGAVGATSSWAILIGGLYLIIRRIIRWQIPVGVLAGAFVMGLIAAYSDTRIEELGWEEFDSYLNVAWFHLSAGGLMIAAVFLATENVSSPVTPMGMLLYGIGIGALTVIIRTWGAPSDGAYYAVLILSAATPLFDRIRPKVLGKSIIAGK